MGHGPGLRPSDTFSGQGVLPLVVACSRGQHESMQVLRELLETQLGAAARVWLTDALAATGSARERAFVLAPRRVGTAPVQWQASDQDQVAAALPGLRLHALRCDQVARMLVLACLPEAAQAACVLRLWAGAETEEAVAIVRALPLIADAAAVEPVARQALRSNVVPLFAAAAQHTPFPDGHFTTLAWNQMVLKALFVGCELWRIQGLDRRRNPDLVAMVVDYATERWAAGRAVPAELWRCAVAPGVVPLAALERGLASDDAREADHAALALAEADDPAALALLQARDPARAATISAGQLAWRQEEEVCRPCV